MGRLASGRSPTRAAARSALRTTAAATAASGRWRPRTSTRWGRGSRSTAFRSATSCACTAPSTRTRPSSARRRIRMAERNIVTKLLARVEGEGAMNVRIRDGLVEEVQLRIYEPPRFFEAFLRGRKFTEVPDITARICGICPVAYQMSSIAAIEDACGVTVPEPVRALRRLLYCGEWVESHGLHVFMLHGPDFLGYTSGFEMARDHPDLVNSALALKKAGNELMRVVGGREIHPVNVRVGGFYRAPTRRELAPVVEQLERAREFAVEAVAWTASLPCPDFDEEFEFVALRGDGLYPIERGRLRSTS